MSGQTPRQIQPVGDLVAFDPGVVHPAGALYRGGVLVRAERVPVDAPPSLDRLDRCVRVGVAVLEWAIGLGARPRYLCAEWPQVYRATKSKGDPNDLLLLAGIDGAFAALLHVYGARIDQAIMLVSYTPAEWAGQLPKATTGDPWASARGQRVHGRLSEAERAAVVPSHDSVDAIGIGLFALGRFARKRVRPGAVPG